MSKDTVDKKTKSSSVRLALVNAAGKVVRVLPSIDQKVHLIQVASTKRLELVGDSDLEIEFVQKKIRFAPVAVVDTAVLEKVPFKFKDYSIQILDSVSGSMEKDVHVAAVKKGSYSRYFYSVLALVAGFLTFVLTREIQTPKLEQELTQQVVQILKKVEARKAQPNLATVSDQKVQPSEVKNATKNDSIKRLGALGALGSLQKSNQKGGLNLNAVQTTAGPGLGGTGGSGGVQTNIYARGLVSAPLGVGGNLAGGGGYGTKGKGGGQAGYGKMEIMGSNGSSSVPLVSEASIDGGLDRSTIADVINRNIGQIRFCYEQGLQGDSSLHGRVAVGFTIDSNGVVRTAKIDNTSLNSRTVEDCIVLRLRSWKFPLPEGGKDVKVSYPFVLKRTGQG